MLVRLGVVLCAAGAIVLNPGCNSPPGQPTPTIPAVPKDPPAPKIDGTTLCPEGHKPIFLHDGFPTLKQYLGDKMGDPLTCEYVNPDGSGDILQRTTTGLAVWRVHTQMAMFTNGSDHWANQSTDNYRTVTVYIWHSSDIDPPAEAVVVPPATPVNPGLVTNGMTTLSVGFGDNYCLPAGSYVEDLHQAGSVESLGYVAVVKLGYLPSCSINPYPPAAVGQRGQAPYRYWR